ncbi:putative protein N(5)-glutamine methyltransferase [Williamsia sp. CHRR-6]|uniref:putative protein N(5)-glutamine methyltransferase n=1 Tax=Williamsia sp. CHRR-6 TaxID=2835871 RepID=UPI001BDB19BD|nr:putative protein N(5)-glutamine methyltransferase [Williamsia sp. CHRR-6]MBT0567274.1 putative protein N(5)-glutamine methyltransferase [Williamsia sp. CHRR-6]
MTSGEDAHLLTVAALRAAGCVFAEDEARLLHRHATSEAELHEVVARRAAGEPLEHILGWVDFCGLRIAVDPTVFVPRRRTELLAQVGVDLIAQVSSRSPMIVELCCGAGAVSAVLAQHHPDAQIWLVDIDSRAVECAQRNVSGATGLIGDLLDPLPPHVRGAVDVMCANAPYVPTDEIALMPTEARDHEPHTALDGGVDGTAIARRIISQAADWLAPGGHLAIETSLRQVPLLIAAMHAAGLVATVQTDPAIDATVVRARRR